MKPTENDSSSKGSQQYLFNLEDFAFDTILTY